MGILPENVKQQYCHRFTQAYDVPLQPLLDPFPTLVKKHWDPSIDGGKQLVIDDTTGDVRPGIEVSVFDHIFEGHTGNGYTIDPDGNPPPVPGIDDGDYWYMLVWNGQWDVLEYKWYEAQAAWFFEASELVTAINFQFVMIWDDATEKTTSTGHFVLLTGTARANLPTWQPLTPQFSVLPDVWIDVPYPATVPVNTRYFLQQVNLSTGQYRQKGYLANPAYKMFVTRLSVSVTGTGALQSIDIDPSDVFADHFIYIGVYDNEYILTMTAASTSYRLPALAWKEVGLNNANGWYIRTMGNSLSLVVNMPSGNLLSGTITLVGYQNN
jgi:hypothetical protein